MRANQRRLLSAAGAILGLVILATAAAAGPGSQGLEKAATHVPESVALPSPESHEPEGEDNGNSGADNHGQCVSSVARSDERAALEDGWRRGMLMSLVAQDKSMVGENCDFSAQLVQAQTAEHPGNAEQGEGNEAGEGQGDETSESAKQGGRGFGESKKAEHSHGS